MTSIQELPAELLREIFAISASSWTVKADRLCYRPTLTRRRSPFNLIAVCQLWRILALRMPSLWDALSPTNNSLPLVEGWLAFLPVSRFDLQIIGARQQSSFDRRHVSAVFKLFSREYKRWNSLSVSLDPALAADLSDFLGRIDLSRLALTSLEIRTISLTQSEEQLNRIIASISSLPNIEHLNFEHRSRTRIAIQDLPWARFKSIRICYGITFSRLLVYLSNCTTARSIEFQMNWMDLDNTPSLPGHLHPPFTLEALTTLALARGTDPLNLLPYFHLPNINTLAIEVGHRNHSSLMHFIKRTQSLQVLLLHQPLLDYGDCAPASQQDLVDWLTAPYLRGLPSFQLSFPKAHTDGIKILQIQAAVGVRFPRLTCWTLNEKLAYSFADASVIGWGHRAVDKQGIFWTFKNGVFEFAELYHRPDAWFNKFSKFWNS